MSNIKKLIFIIIISLLYPTKSDAVIKDSLFATVGHKAITRSDIIDEIKIILILNGQSYTEEKKKQLETAAIQSTIKRNIKIIEIEKYGGLEFNREELNDELKRLANGVNMDVETLQNTFVANGINFLNIVEQMQTELLWNSLIFELYKDRLSVNLNEIDEQLKLIQNKKEIEEYFLSEIILNPIPRDKLESEIKKINDKIKTDGFEKVAMNLSISETAIKGGNLGWISENIISEEFKYEILATPLGNISRPILLPEGILLIKVKDKRKIEKFINLEEAKNQLVEAEKQKILNMHSLSHYDNLRRSISINYY